jgi:type II secretion system protein G
MTTCERQAGFTLIEVIVVLAVMGLLLGAAMPLAGAVVQANRRQEAQDELARLAEALDAYYFERAAFPASLQATDFLGVFLQPGPGDTVVFDPFGAGQTYVYTVNGAAGTATVHSRGEDGVDNGANQEEHVVRVFAAVPGARRTRQRLRVVVEVLANHIESGGSVTGTWPQLRAAMGLGASYDTDGFGTTLRWTAATHTLESAGPDRVFGTADDLVL